MHIFIPRNGDACRVRVRVSGNLHLGTPIDLFLVYRAYIARFALCQSILFHFEPDGTLRSILSDM